MDAKLTIGRTLPVTAITATAKRGKGPMVIFPYFPFESLSPIALSKLASPNIELPLSSSPNLIVPLHLSKFNDKFRESSDRPSVTPPILPALRSIEELNGSEESILRMALFDEFDPALKRFLVVVVPVSRDAIIGLPYIFTSFF